MEKDLKKFLELIKEDSALQKKLEEAGKAYKALALALVLDPVRVSLSAALLQMKKKGDEMIWTIFLERILIC